MQVMSISSVGVSAMANRRRPESQLHAAMEVPMMPSQKSIDSHPS
jgi:hypothetical protein